jgi:hypothetical protein
MQMNQAETTLAFSAQAQTTQPREPSFNSVWGNEMQREDFLALAAGVRQFSVGLAQMAFVTGAPSCSTEHAHYAVE